MKLNNWLHYLLLVAVFIFFTYLFSTSLQTDEVIRTSLSGQYSNEIISNYLESRKKWAWLGYVLVPVLKETEMFTIELIKKLKEDKVIFIVSHKTKTLEQLSDTVLCLQKGVLSPI